MNKTELLKARHSPTDDLKAFYFGKNGVARRGKDLLDKYISRSDADGLLELLRHHDEEGIDDDETWDRDAIDYLLEYFSMLCVAHCVGYVSYDEVFDERDEICLYLGNLAVKQYYTKHYPLVLPQILLDIVLLKKTFPAEKAAKVNPELFPAFYALQQTLLNDDVDRFLWFLDGGSDGPYDIDDLVELIKDTGSWLEFAPRREKSPLSQSLRGFFDYLIFLKNFSDLLGKVKTPLERSAYWHLHQYWFSRIKSQLKRSVNTLFTGMELFARENRDEFPLLENFSARMHTTKQENNRLVDRMLSHPASSVLEERWRRWRKSRYL